MPPAPGERAPAADRFTYLFGSTLPGDVAPDNHIVLEPDMFFVIHPNQFLPETSYMMCGEPTLITENGAELLSQRMAQLYEIPV